MTKIEQSINLVERKQTTLLILNSQNDIRNPDLDLNHEEARKIQRSQEIQCNFKEAYLLIKMTIKKGGRVESLPKRIGRSNISLCTMAVMVEMLTILVMIKILMVEKMIKILMMVSVKTITKIWEDPSPCEQWR